MVRKGDSDADVTASLTDSAAYLHVVNTSLENPLKLTVKLDGAAPTGEIKVHEIAPSDPTVEVTPQTPDVFNPQTRTVAENEVVIPAAGVAVVEIPRG